MGVRCVCDALDPGPDMPLNIAQLGVAGEG
jgi:hypothetical protein